jgi:serine/threonine-protein kinase
MTHDPTVFHRISDSVSTRSTWAGISSELLEQARGRVKAVALLMLIVTGLGTIFDLSYAGLVIGNIDPVWIAASVLGLGFSVAIFFVARGSKASHLTVLKLGLLYEITLCLILAVITPWMEWAETGSIPFVTWVPAIIIFFPLIVPSPPRVTLITAMAAAATRPLGLVLLVGLAGIEVPGVRWLASVLSPLFAAVLAYAGSRIIHGLNVDLSRARRLGSYTLDAKLGTGGMGEVWSAQHRLLARPAAVKLIRPEVVARDPEHQGAMLARFEREAQVTAALNSPHTVQLYDFGIEQGGSFYYVMELLDGLDLEAFVSRFGPLVPARAVHLLRQMCDSLGEAHSRELIHRDVKPANTYVCRYGRRVDFVKVLDFGLVKSRHERGDEEDQKLTAEHVVGGTPAFIAPEQVKGGEVDGRTDIYSLGCVAFWMLTGTPVFAGESALETMVMHVRDDPPRPSSRTELPVTPDLDRAMSESPGPRSTPGSGGRRICRGRRPKDPYGPRA